MKIKFIDINQSLVDKVAEAIKYLPVKNVSAECGDIFKQEGVIVSASNPNYSMGGGLDALIAKKYPKECEKVKKGVNQRIRDVIFTITVDENLKSSRELVLKALQFALSKGKSNETLLISGLGTGIGGLDEDDFVWLFLVAICEKNKLGWGIKFTKKDGNSNGTNRKTGEPVKYVVGEYCEVKDAPKDKEECGHGLHLGKSFIGAGNYAMPEKVFFCIYNKKDFCGEGDDKIRVSRLLPLYEMPQWLGYGLNGKKIVSKIGKKFNPEKYNPYKATKLPSLKQIFKDWPLAVRAQVGDQVWAQVGDQVGAQVGDQVGAQVGDQVGDQVWAQVGDQVWAQVGDQVGDQVWAQVWAQVGDQVGDQVWDQVWANSYWSINAHFELNISHWFGNFLNLGVMLIFAMGKIKVFGKKGKFLGEYDEKDFKSLD